ncbi:hypothetical protein VOLCADRAFT_93411 [Volvox carteri f. nagariensis]|uniref:Uncharacterized protein n=1 Tax=Volvox carteri f. nagariensis TaxID=3068 RepID=D8U220_VOLCA|nr:uncharacterized protein VOLCADRAFT_93411 [Volvox carteri f. nagariensis]EFJ46204.1 hypothetical protein VOLCADRAFT_93411 [Volvox carteri f. nagariensis]|eukprot:XP_002952651.1 hypothetical protein VOLCADRAFT_93411 [Volvox carteri f. nagariensis]
MATYNDESDAGFFDDFNRDPDKQAVMEDVNRKLCEALTELAENIVDALVEADARAAKGVVAAAAAAAAQRNVGADTEAAEEEEAGVSSGDTEEVACIDEVAALAAYNDALSAIMREKNVTSKVWHEDKDTHCCTCCSIRRRSNPTIVSDMCALPDEHPLKELFFSAFDEQLFHDLLERFVSQVRNRKEGPGDWDAEAADGECDEDHTLE